MTTTQRRAARNRLATDVRVINAAVKALAETGDWTTVGEVQNLMLTKTARGATRKDLNALGSKDLHEVVFRVLEKARTRGVADHADAWSELAGRPARAYRLVRKATFRVRDDRLVAGGAA